MSNLKGNLAAVSHKTYLVWPILVLRVSQILTALGQTEVLLFMLGTMKAYLVSHLTSIFLIIIMF